MIVESVEVAVPSGPGTEDRMPKYRLYDADGNDLGEMRLGDVPFRVGDEIFVGPGKTLRVVDVVPIDENDSPYAGSLKVEAP